MIDDAEAPIRMEHEQRVIIKFLFNDGLNPRQIVEKLESQFQKDGCSFRAVRCGIGEARRGPEDLYSELRPGSPQKSISQPTFRTY
jgi:hypothetical protein